MTSPSNNPAGSGKNPDSPDSPEPLARHEPSEPGPGQPPAESAVKRPEKPPLADSPWFWAYIFSAAALVALAMASPKYYSRQTQLERQFLARQEGGQTIKGSDGQSIEPPMPDNLILRLGPLFLICGTLLLVAWSRFWWTRFDGRTQNGTSERPANIPGEQPTATGPPANSDPPTR